ncbi:hypothetical protein A2U01_0073886, partial [Trifolium medium]|nr:hypothetical protein [Trifolium medium]
ERGREENGGRWPWEEMDGESPARDEEKKKDEKDMKKEWG